MLKGMLEHIKKNFLRQFWKSLGTILRVPRALSWPQVIVGFSKEVILITYGMEYLHMQAISQAYFLAQEYASSPM